MKKRLLAGMIAICCAAQPVLAQNDAKAKNILEAVSKKINSFKTIKADITLRLTGKNTIDNKKITIYTKGDKYYALLNGQEIICDGKTIWTYVKDTKELQISNYDPNAQTLSPAKLLTNFYDKEYKYTYKGEQKLKGKNCDVVELLPTDKSKQFSKIDLMINKATGIIAGGSIWEKNGNQYQYEISNFTPNANIPDSYFTWDAKAHPGVEIVDLR